MPVAARLSAVAAAAALTLLLPVMVVVTWLAAGWTLRLLEQVGADPPLAAEAPGGPSAPKP